MTGSIRGNEPPGLLLEHVMLPVPAGAAEYDSQQQCGVYHQRQHVLGDGDVERPLHGRGVHELAVGVEGVAVLGHVFRGEDVQAVVDDYARQRDGDVGVAHLRDMPFVGVAHVAEEIRLHVQSVLLLPGCMQREREKRQKGKQYELQFAAHIVTSLFLTLTTPKRMPKLCGVPSASRTSMVPGSRRI